ncbi:replicative helicase loader/inhibitor [Mesobacillus selenatarsenatis]|uniref:replicative helicase loader/inhibitor n=1 Tax=Mesobacillus selenatarsenatis TaxID=388741 RepID=UPI0005A6A007|nr:replicative helicase loader/inhibitor [Mesobacillus selenatarsenatis]
MTKIEALKVLNLIENCYPLVTLKSETILMWMAKCESLDYSKVLNKLAIHIRSNPYPPTVQEILERSCNEGKYFEWLEEYSIRIKKTKDFVANSKNF